MKKTLIVLTIVCFLGFIGGVYGKKWSKTKYPEIIPTNSDISETFSFSEDYGN